MIIATLLEHFPLSSATWQALPSAQALLSPLQAFTAANPAAQRLVTACGLVLQPHIADLADAKTVLDGRVALAGTEGTAAAPVEIEAAPCHLMDRILACLHAGKQEQRRAADFVTASGANSDTLTATHGMTERACGPRSRDCAPWTTT
jgi:hypothetical protein